MYAQSAPEAGIRWIPTAGGNRRGNDRYTDADLIRYITRICFSWTSRRENGRSSI